jgi:hypothetical protein
MVELSFEKALDDDFFEGSVHAFKADLQMVENRKAKTNADSLRE